MTQVKGKFWVNIGGAIGDAGEAKFGFRAPLDSYDNIRGELGVHKLGNIINDRTGNNNSARGILFGANYPKPPKVRINFRVSRLGGGASNDHTRSALRYCDPDNLGSVLNGALNDQKIKVNGTERAIDSVSI